MYIKLRQSIYLTLALGMPLISQAQTTPTKANDSSTTLDEVVVTGSLIKHVATETVQPITVITAEDIKARGYTNIADALQQTAFATGSVQGPQASDGFTQGARTVSLFGLSPSYVKYLIDGLPMSDYPALYNGTDTFVSIGGIPLSMVDRIEILPGGQSSLYGSDAIAGVINIIMKKKIDGLNLDARYEATRAGGGTGRTLSVANSWSHNDLTILAGAQYDKTDPIWGYQRGLTANIFSQGTSPAVGTRDYAIFGLNGMTGDGLNDYYYTTPQDCAKVSNEFGGNESYLTRPNHGNYCGATINDSAAYYTINNGSEESDVYLRATDEIDSTHEFYADLLMSHNVTSFSNGLGTYNSSFDPRSTYSNFWDPNYNDQMSLQHNYSPEEIGNISNAMSYDNTDSVRATLGYKGAINKAWDYDIAINYSQQKLIEKAFNLLTSNVEAFYAPVFGKSQGIDPSTGATIYTPNYGALFQPITPAQYASLNGVAVNHSRTETALYRMQITDSDLMKMKGGDAGLAVVSEVASQSWKYIADPGFATNEFFGLTSGGSSNGSRRRYSLTSELRLPALETLTADLSARYDSYHLDAGDISKGTYMMGVEYRPMQNILARARYGTAFKAPTLSDEYQSLSGAYGGALDYYQCFLHGYTAQTLVNCPYPSGGSVFLQTSGNTKLKPINASVWNAGLVWDVVKNASVDIDYLHWVINNEVTEQSSDKLLQEEAACRLGQLDIKSPTCVADLAQVTRDSSLQLVSIYTPKINVSQEAVNALTTKGTYHLPTASVGGFDFSVSETYELKHTYQQYAGDPFIDLLRNPFYSSDFKTKVNATVNWDFDSYSTTLYAIRNGRTPNYLATISPEGYATPGAGSLGPYTALNLSVGYKWSPAFTFTARVTNLFNAMPPEDHSYPGTSAQPYNSGNYDPYGREFQLEIAYHPGNN